MICSGCTGTASEASSILGSDTTLVADIGSSRGDGNGKNLTSFDRQAFRRFLAEDKTSADKTQVPADVEQFFGKATDERLDAFIAQSCGQLDADLLADGVSSAISAVWQSLTADDQALLSFDEVAVAMDIATEFFCAHRQPASGAELDHLAAAGDLAGFRQFVASAYEPDASIAVFVGGLSDERLGELHQQACLLSAEDENLVEFGETAFNHYADQLTPAEQMDLELAAYVEVFILFIDWFCPDRLDPSA